MAGAAKDLTPEEFAQWAGGLDRWWGSFNARVPLKWGGVAIVAQTKQHFATATGPDGSPWKAIRGFRVRGAAGDVGRPLRDRGLLMGSVTAASGQGHIERLEDFQLVWGTNLDYARIHQEGGTILPKSGRALAIPWTREAYRAGGPRNFPGQLALVWPAGRRTGWLVENKGKGKQSRTVMHYLLVPKVTIPARPFLGFNDAIADKFALIFADWLESELRRGGTRGPDAT